MKLLELSPLKCVLGDAVATENSSSYHFPSSEVLSDGSIYVCARKDKGMNDPYGTTEAVRYIRETGELIPMPSPTAYDVKEDGSKTAYSCYVSELAPNELVAVYGLITPEGREVLFDEVTFGMCKMTLRITFSHDNGYTWDVPKDLEYKTEDIMVPSKIFKTKDGIWGFHIEMHNHWEVDYKEAPKARFVYSEDGGKTFDKASDISTDPNFLPGDARPTTDAKGNLCSFFWGFDLKEMKDKAIFRSASENGGLTWSDLEPINLKKQITSPFWIDDDTYMCIYQERFSENPGLYGCFSYDGGMNWDEENAVGIFVKGKAPKSENAFDSGNDEAYTFGYSTLTKLAPDVALVTFWHANGGTTCISVCELKIK